MLFYKNFVRVRPFLTNHLPDSAQTRYDVIWYFAPIFIFCTLRIFYIKMASSQRGGGLHILTWETPAKKILFIKMYNMKFTNFISFSFHDIKIACQKKLWSDRFGSSLIILSFLNYYFGLKMSIKMYLNFTFSFYFFLFIEQFYFHRGLLYIYNCW